MGLGSGKTTPDPGSRVKKAPDPGSGSATLIFNVKLRKRNLDVGFGIKVLYHS
jgi:hypothetical protein